jgi:hypothetical protein
LESFRRAKAAHYATGHRPPGKIFLGLGVIMLAINHLWVVLGNGIVAEALVAGCWLVFMGAWVLVSVRSFDAVWGWAKPSARREIGLGLLTVAIAVGRGGALAGVANRPPRLGCRRLQYYVPR